MTRTLSGDEEEAKAKEETQPAPVPVPPPSVAPPLQGVTVAVESAPVPAPVPVDLGKASDPRLPPQPQAVEPQQQDPRQELAPVPAMPQMPQMPVPQGPPQPSYNTKEDGYVILVNDKVVVGWTRIPRSYLSSSLTQIDRHSPRRLHSTSQLVLGRLYRPGSPRDQMPHHCSTLSLDRLGQVLAKECPIYAVLDSTYRKTSQ